MIIWLTGQPGSGKTTLATALQNELRRTHFTEREDLVVNIDGDGLREVFQNFDYTEKGRRENISSAILVARWLDADGFFVIVSLVSPYRGQREELKATNVVREVYLRTSEIRGREEFFVTDYEPPLKDFISIDTGIQTVDESIYFILESIEELLHKRSDL